MNRLPMTPGMRAEISPRMFECLGFAVVQRDPLSPNGWHDVFKDGEWVDACERRHVERLCLRLLRSPT